jgi:hypothetical protein
MADVAVVTMSEFGRTVAENGNAGSDHGHGTTMLVMGWAARGGRVLGRWPPGARFEDRDLGGHQQFSESVRRDPGRPPRRCGSRRGFPGAFPAPALGVFG